MSRRLRPKPEFALQQRVEQMWEEFDYPDQDVPQIPFELGTGGGAPTVVVAASDATDLSKQKADFICTGTNDDATIQRALNIADRSFDPGSGGRILLTEGVFNCRYNVITTSFNTIGAPNHIQGMGLSTVLNFSGIGSGLSGNMAGIDINGEGGLVSDLLMVGNSVSGVKAIEIDSTANRSVIRNVVMTGFDGGANSVITVFLADEVVIEGCRILDSFAIGIAMAASNDTVIRNNQINVESNSAILVDEGTGLAISGNRIGADEHGISLETVTNSLVTDNRIIAPGRDGNHDGIILVADVENTYVNNNLVVPDSVAAPRYGINIAAVSCDCNIVVGNALGPVADYGSDALNDDGADTQLFWPADATYGDNFTDCIPSSPTSP